MNEIKRELILDYEFENLMNFIYFLETSNEGFLVNMAYCKNQILELKNFEPDN